MLQISINISEFPYLHKNLIISHINWNKVLVGSKKILAGNRICFYLNEHGLE